jgi:hypothetical protein
VRFEKGRANHIRIMIASSRSQSILWEDIAGDCNEEISTIRHIICLIVIREAFYIIPRV